MRRYYHEDLGELKLMAQTKEELIDKMEPMLAAWIGDNIEIDNTIYNDDTLLNRVKELFEKKLIEA
jgi:hypothetical protein